ncbi:hypothetical protein C7974DRAFT_161296 [Boeremia exigua]|uniref:uncharacterized protein n=1 Tax=Boeremia exigua TaxID=749465 RepID=UPI001E8DC99F|nr:uncharacterized protein C7974DRAFT_161296 [Boeremia exigua]KAH6638456.1 hypothetical protein C7974DRAFT_161296 [Boeremia exigua]
MAPSPSQIEAATSPVEPLTASLARKLSTESIEELLLTSTGGKPASPAESLSASRVEALSAASIETQPASPTESFSTNATKVLPLGLVETLPTEILENIFLYAVDEVSSPEPTHSDCNKVSRLLAELHTRVSDTLQALRFRLVCRKFRDASWRAFGKVVGVTTFDIRSRQSMSNFQAVSTEPNLTPWIKDINFTCNVSGETPSHALRATPSESDLTSGLREVRQDDTLWFPDLFYDFNIDRVVNDLEIGKLVQFFATCVQKLKNIERAAYFSDESLPPQRFKPAGASSRSKIPEHMHGSTGNGGRGAQFGLFVFFSALSDAGAQPRVLDLAVEFGEGHAFISTVPNVTLLKLFAKVESLTLRDKYNAVCLLTGQHGSCSRVCLTKTLFPALRSVTIDHGNGSGILEEDETVSFPPESELPRLLEIAIIYHRETELCGKSFLAHYGKEIKSLTIDTLWPDYYFMPEFLEEIVELTQDMDLETLILRNGLNETWENVFEFIPDYPRVTEDIKRDLVTAARRIVLEPLMFEEYLSRP